MYITDAHLCSAHPNSRRGMDHTDETPEVEQMREIKPEARRTALSSMATHELKRSNDPEWSSKSKVVYDGKAPSGRGASASRRNGKMMCRTGASQDELVFSADFEGGQYAYTCFLRPFRVMRTGENVSGCDRRL